MPRPSAAGARRTRPCPRWAPQGSSRSIAPRRCESSAPRPSSVRLAMPTLRAGRTRTRPSARGCAGEYHRIGLKRAVPDRTGRYDARRVVVGGSPERPHVDHPRSTTVPAENLTRAEAHGRAAVVQVESYDVVLDLTTGPDTFASTTVVRFDATPGAGTFIDLIAPAHWTVISNSPTPAPVAVPGGVNRNGGQDAGAATWSFEPTPRLASYVTAVIAGPYHRETSTLTSSDGRTIPLGVLCRASLAEHLDADNIVDITRAGFTFYEDLFGAAYPFAKYDQIFVPEFNAGAMENAGAVTFVESYVFRSKVAEATVERRAATILHELAHMWFGDLVTMRWWDDLWLNESFAEYVSTLATAETTRWTSAWTTFSSVEKSWAYRQDQLPSTHPIVADIRDLEDVEVNFDGITYAKGASVLKQLVSWVGQEEFFAGVRAYFARHAWGNTELRDLLVELERTSGRDLQAWSALWLERAGITLLRPHMETDAHDIITAFEVLQEVRPLHPVQRPHRLAVSGYDVVAGPDGKARLDRVVRAELDINGARTSVT